ncbi:MAG: hypothetical protein JWQ87_3288, partial [Candidatus Sulfotelmatobacter sp.]|nr:hypothetical protein [Candidatus Sulfotelmatobacter sp.]
MLLRRAPESAHHLLLESRSSHVCLSAVVPA